jgi:hypothetical protein
VASRYLPIYLNDHVAGATAGVALARRLHAENSGTDLGAFMSGLAQEINDDRETLVQLMKRLEIAPSRLKLGAASIGEKVARLKPNGHVVGYSPLSRLVELEALSTGIAGKRALWLALERIRDNEQRLRETDFAALAERAASQLERLEPHRLDAAATAFADRVS